MPRAIHRGPIGRLLTRLTDNTPFKKPELWAHLPRTVARSAFWWAHMRMRTELVRRPFVANLEPEGRLEVTPGEAISQSILLYGLYEYGTSLVVRHLLRPGDNFVDVGANLGYYTVIAGLAVGNRGSVTSFEPLTSIRTRLIRNISLNGLSNVAVRPEVVGSQTGPVAFYEPVDVTNLGLGSMVKPSGDYRAYQLACVRLDDALGAVPRLVKIDVEGAEPEVFEGARELLRREDAPVVVFESHNLDRAAGLLRDAGYRVWLIDLRKGRPYLRPIHVGERPPTPARLWDPPNYLAARQPTHLRMLSPLLADN
jgi:FkbM family methyltransferase